MTRLEEIEARKVEIKSEIEKIDTMQNGRLSNRKGSRDELYKKTPAQPVFLTQFLKVFIQQAIHKFTIIACLIIWLTF